MSLETSSAGGRTRVPLIVDSSRENIIVRVAALYGMTELEALDAYEYDRRSLRAAVDLSNQVVAALKSRPK